MADIAAYLLEAINGPGPQHKIRGRDKFEFSEGSDGATHTKIVGVDGKPVSSLPVSVVFPAVQNVEVTNPADPVVFPSNQNVTDAGVKAELESIKGTQAQIISALQSTNESLLATNEHLNSVIKDERLQSDTQLIGSNVGYSTDEKPVGKEGDSYIELDTKKVFLHDGTKWSEF